MNRFLVTLSAFLFLSYASAQSEDLNRRELSLIAGPSYNNIKNANIETDEYASSKGTFWFNFGLNYCKYYSKNIGLFIGAEYSRFNNVTDYKGAFKSDSKSIDRDNYIYYAYIEADYKDTRIVHTLDLPLGLRLNLPLSSNAEFFCDLGVKANFVLVGKYRQEGTHKNKGLYPNVNYDNVFLMIEDDSYLGYSNKTYNSEADLRPNRLVVSFILSTGLKAKMTEKSWLIINPMYAHGLTDITSKNKNEYENVFGEKSPYQKFLLRQFALRVGISFDI
jgi:hypothetical protein